MTPNLSFDNPSLHPFHLFVLYNNNFRANMYGDSAPFHFLPSFTFVTFSSLLCCFFISLKICTTIFSSKIYIYCYWDEMRRDEICMFVFIFTEFKTKNILRKIWLAERKWLSPWHKLRRSPYAVRAVWFNIYFLLLIHDVPGMKHYEVFGVFGCMFSGIKCIYIYLFNRQKIVDLENMYV